jgi:hypothetical protein
MPVTAAADVDPWTVRAPSFGFGSITVETPKGYHDVFLNNPQANGPRIAGRLEWGGSLVYFGLPQIQGSNAFDDNDTGRELQIALYDPTRQLQGCAWNATCGQPGAFTCPAQITYLGWDPVQGGDECGHGSAASWQQVGDALQLVAHPFQWNPDWDKQDCAMNPCPPAGVPTSVTLTLELRFVASNVVEVMTEVSSQENIDHPAAEQEFPTLYVANGGGGPDLKDLLDADGTFIPIGFPVNFTSPKPYVMWQNANHDYGVGLAMDQGLLSFQGWGDATFHNVRPRLPFGLNHGATVRGLSYVVLGNVPTIQSFVKQVLDKRPPFGHVDLPAAQFSYGKGAPVDVSGWVLDNAHIASVTAEIDGMQAAILPVATARPDVCDVYPGYDGCPSAGFSGSVPTAGLDACPHLLRITATDADGNKTVLGERVLAPM